MERKLVINAFRNIGFKDGKPSNEGLIINHSLEKGKMGDLVILVGANNSGKSNVLDALISLQNGAMKDRDITDLYMEDECRNPILSLTSKDNKIIYTLKMSKDGNVRYSYPEKEENKKFDRSKLENLNFNNLDSNEILNEIKILANIEKENELEDKRINNLLESINDLNKYDINLLALEVANIIADYFENQNGIYQTMQSISDRYYPYISAIKRLCNEYMDNLSKYDSINKINEAYNSRYGIIFKPNIYFYEQKTISNSNLSSSYANIQKSQFFNELLKAINVDAKVLSNAHNNFLKTNNKGILIATEKNINKKLEKVSNEFNKLYCLEDTKYTFQVSLESEKIYFSLFRGENAISLDYQSTGFRWFFDLYFNLFAANTINPGDVVIMDEPATNLHVLGQTELRNFLKTFSMKNDITIIIATHSPFLIDIDYLDELRIISNKNNITSIDNDFSAVNIDDPDSLEPVKRALTCQNRILFDSDQIVVFVEGITDYNYFVAMKKALNYDNISFLPIKGVGKNVEQQKSISEKLIKIRKHNPVLLVDNDKAGKEMKQVNKESELTVITLGDVDPSFKTIESLFSMEDAKKLGVIDEKNKPIKHHNTSAVIKNSIIQDPSMISEETKNNFKKVFDRIIDN